MGTRALRAVLALPLLALPCAAAPLHVRGRVVAPDGKGIAGAQVTLWPGEESGGALKAPLTTAADGQGSYALDAPGPGVYRVVARAAGRVSLERSLAPLLRDADLGPVALPPATGPVLVQAVSDTGRPVAGALVSVVLPGARPPAPSAGWRPVLPGAMTDARGNAVLSGLRGLEAYEIHARHKDFGGARRTLRTPAPRRPVPPVRLVLPARRTVAGRVLDPDDRPAPRARWKIEPASPELDDEGLSAGEADEQGRFEIPRLAPGAYRLSLFVDDVPPLRDVAVEVPAGAPRIDLGDLRLPAGVTLEGRVTDADGAPLAGARVWKSLGDIGFELMSFDFRESPPDARTGADGRFRFSRLTEGAAYDVHVEREGYLPSTVPGLKLPVQGTLEMALKTARGLAGRVVGPDGEPVAGAAVERLEQRRVRGLSDISTEELATTDERGEFRAAGVAPGPLDLLVKAGGYAPRTVRGLAVPADGDLEGVQVELGRAATLLVHVVSAEGEPARTFVEAALVRTASGDDLDTKAFAVEGALPSTDERGIALIEVPGPGLYSVQTISGAPAPVLVEAGPGTTPVEIRLRAGVEVSGWVLDAGGEGVAGAIVELKSADGGSLQDATGGSGDFHFGEIADGTFLLAARKEGYGPAAPREVAVAGAAVQGLEVRLGARQEGAALAGRLLGLAEEELAAAGVEATSAEGGRSFGRPGPDGRYELRDLQPGDWQVIAMAGRDGRRRLTRSLRLGPDGAAAVLDFDFRHSATLTGQVLVDGAPCIGAEVAAACAGFLPKAVWSGYGGRFEIPDLPPGTCRLAVDGERGSVHDERTVELDGDRELAVEIHTGMLSGRVSDGDGRPVEGALVLVDIPDSGDGPLSAPAVRSGADGAFAERLAAGTYLLTVRREGFADARQTAQVQPGETGAPVEIRLKPKEKTAP